MPFKTVKEKVSDLDIIKLDISKKEIHKEFKEFRNKLIENIFSMIEFPKNKVDGDKFYYSNIWFYLKETIAKFDKKQLDDIFTSVILLDDESSFLSAHMHDERSETIIQHSLVGIMYEDNIHDEMCCVFSNNLENYLLDEAGTNDKRYRYETVIIPVRYIETDFLLQVHNILTDRIINS